MILHQIEALKAVGVTEVVLAINYQPEVNFLPITEFTSMGDSSTASYLLNEQRKCLLVQLIRIHCPAYDHVRCKHILLEVFSSQLCLHILLQAGNKVRLQTSFPPCFWWLMIVLVF